MITKGLYLKAIDVLEEFDDLAIKLRKLGVDIDCLDDSPFYKICYQLQHLMEYCTKDTEDGYSTMLEYFIYDREYGKKIQGYPCLWDKEGHEIPFKTKEDLWNFLVSQNPDIEDKENS